MANPPRRTMSSREAAEAVFKPVAAKPVEIPVKKPAVPGARELVSLRIDRDILDHRVELEDLLGIAFIHPDRDRARLTALIVAHESPGARRGEQDLPIA